MKRITVLAAALALSATAAFAADPVEGVWQTVPDDNGNFGHVQMSACGDRFCGVLIRAYNGEGRQIESPNVGRRLIWNMRAKGDGSYSGGKVYSPDRDKTYNSRLQLSGDRLGVKGCVIGICRDGGTWLRVK